MSLSSPSSIRAGRSVLKGYHARKPARTHPSISRPPPLVRGRLQVTGCARCSNDTPHAPLATLSGLLSNQRPRSVLLPASPHCRIYCERQRAYLRQCEMQPWASRPCTLRIRSDDRRHQPIPHHTRCGLIHYQRALACAQQIQCMLCHHRTAPYRPMLHSTPTFPEDLVHKGSQTYVRQSTPRHGQGQPRAHLLAPSARSMTLQVPIEAH